MEKLEVYNCADILIGSYFTDDRGCAHENREHTLIYLVSGELTITERGTTTVLHPGDCAFMRRDNRMWLQKTATTEVPYHSIVLKFSRPFLRSYFQTLQPKDLPTQSRRDTTSLRLLPSERPDIKSLFESVRPFFESGAKPSDEVLKLKMTEGLLVLLSTDINLYASLFDFVEPWKIDIIDFLEENYMEELTMQEIAQYTGRSLATFKRDFAKISPLTPQKWIFQRRLQEAHRLISGGAQKITDVCYRVGFKNLSHFSRIYKAEYGVAPSL